MAQQQVTRTRFGDSLRALADLADQAPSLLGAIAHPTVPSRLSVQVTTSDAVAAIAQDLGAIVNLYKGEDGSFQWSLLIQRDLAALDVFAIEYPEKELAASSSPSPSHSRSSSSWSA